mgnify:FL=1
MTKVLIRKSQNKYNNLRKLKSLLYLKSGNDFFLNIVNDGTVVYGERPKTIFENYSNFENNDQAAQTNDYYNSLLIKLTNKVKDRNSEIIYITQISGIGMNERLFVIANTIISHCNDYKLKCINLAKNANLQYDDFYDWAHLNRKGSEKVADFLSEKFLKLAIN